MTIRKWWVCSTNKTSGHQSRVGPFDTVVAAAKFVDEEREQEHWRNVRIHSRQGRRR